MKSHKKLLVIMIPQRLHLKLNKNKIKEMKKRRKNNNRAVRNLKTPRRTMQARPLANW